MRKIRKAIFQRKFVIVRCFSCDTAAEIVFSISAYPFRYSYIEPLLLTNNRLRGYKKPLLPYIRATGAMSRGTTLSLYFMPFDRQPVTLASGCT